MFKPKHVANRFIMDYHHLVDKFILQCKSVRQTIDYHSTQLCRSFKQCYSRVKKKVRVRSIKLYRTSKRRCRSFKRRISSRICKAFSSVEAFFNDLFFTTEREESWDDLVSRYRQDGIELDPPTPSVPSGIHVNMQQLFNYIRLGHLTLDQRHWIREARSTPFPPPTHVRRLLVDFVVSEDYDCLALLPFVSLYTNTARCVEVIRQYNVDLLRRIIWIAGDEFYHDPLILAARQVVGVEAAATRSACEILLPRRRRSGRFETPGRISR